MITIRTGELFVEKYNEENGTNLSPKEIFIMLAEKSFRGGRHMIFWRNSKFHYYLNAYNDFLKGKKKEPSFEDALNSFCHELENSKRGLETSLNVYGGCADPKPNEMQTTEFNYCDNLCFTIDERYCSFIGSFFLIQVGEFATVINNKNIIWLLYESFNRYYDFIHNNDGIKDKQLPTWNGCYLYQTLKKQDEFIVDKKIKGNSICTIDFLEYLDAISRLENVNLSNMAFESFGQTNVTCGYITLDIRDVKGWFNIFDKIVVSIDDDFDIEKYCKTFEKESLLRICMEFGEVTSDMIHPLFDLKARMKNNEFNKENGIKFLKEYLKIIMTEKENQMAKDFGAFLAESKKSKGGKALSFKIEIDNIFSARKVTDLGNAIIAFCNKADVSYKEGSVPYDVITYFTKDKSREKLMEFLMYTKFNM